MKLSNETKVGALTIIALALLFIGFNYLKGKDLFTPSKKIFAVFSDLGSLEKSNEVKINGLPVGYVYQKQEKDKDVSAIIVTINLTRNINIPRNSVAYIASSLVGSSFIVIERGNESAFLQDGDTIQTRKETGLLGDVKAQLDPTISNFRSILDSLKKTLAGINDVLNARTRNDLRETIANLNIASAALNNYLLENGPVNQSLENISNITQRLTISAASIEQVTDHAATITSSLVSLPLKKTFDTLAVVIDKLNLLTTSLHKGEGTAGALLNDKQLYDQLQKTLLSAEILLDDLRSHPKRYASFSVFGKKDKSIPLTAPISKDSLPRK
ncbi:MAG: MCE family protein [Bacteroidetes bacterium]|nr:MCE family protein [Bacteroidota bacterium]